MRKAFITLIAASSMMSSSAFASNFFAPVEACKQLYFGSVERYLLYESVKCRRGSFILVNERDVIFVEPENGGPIACKVSFVDRDYDDSVFTYHVTKRACDHPNEFKSNRIVVRNRRGNTDQHHLPSVLTLQQAEKGQGYVSVVTVY